MEDPSSSLPFTMGLKVVPSTKQSKPNHMTQHKKEPLKSTESINTYQHLL